MQAAALKIEQKKRGITDADYRALLMRLTGKSSSTLLSDDERKRVYIEMTHPKPTRRETAPKTPAARKIWALWYQLMPYLKEEERNVNYLLGIVRRASGNDYAAKLGDLAPKEEYLAIEALKQRLDYEDKQQKEVPF